MSTTLRASNYKSKYASSSTKKKQKVETGTETRRQRQRQLLFFVLVVVSLILSFRSNWSLSQQQAQVYTDNNNAPVIVSISSSPKLNLSSSSSSSIAVQPGAPTTTAMTTAATATATATTSTTTTTTTTKPTSTSTATSFVRHDHVAIVTKIHGPHQWGLLLQSMCLLHYAYNHKVLYDIIVFTADPIPADDIESFKKMVAPVNVTIVIDNIGFQEEVAALTPIKREKFLERCNVTDPVNLTWWSGCRSENDGAGVANFRLAYNWQAEFRSVRIWNHPALADYKYMVWLDSDGFCTQEWEKDPVAYFIENDGVIMFDNFPQGNSPARTKPLILKGFNNTVCDLKYNNEKRHFERRLVGPNDTACPQVRVPNIHGFFHITSLDFYRSQPVKHGLETLLGECFLCRSPDDQLAVTIPAAILAPEKSWDMRNHGFHLNVFHNMAMDGKERVWPRSFIKYWKNGGNLNFTSADGVCRIDQAD